MNEDERLMHKLQSIRQSIRKKQRDLKRSIMLSTMEAEDTFKPILEPLKTIGEQLSVNKEILAPPPQSSTKKEEGEDVVKQSTGKRSKTETPPSTPLRFLTTDIVAETPEADSPTVSHVLSTPQGQRMGEDLLNTVPLGILAKEYVKRLITDRNKSIDTTYGPHYEGNELMIGDKKVTFNRNDIYVHGTRYKGTPGLYELIFMNEPDEELYDENDLAAYKSIMIATNAHRQGYNPDGRLNSNRGVKYRNVIGKLFGRFSGEGLINKSVVTDVDYVYWNDVNELVDRLKLLVASQSAGHTGHSNEIVSIIEELREAGVIV